MQKVSVVKYYYDPEKKKYYIQKDNEKKTEITKEEFEALFKNDRVERKIKNGK